MSVDSEALVSNLCCSRLSFIAFRFFMTWESSSSSETMTVLLLLSARDYSKSFASSSSSFAILSRSPLKIGVS